MNSNEIMKSIRAGQAETNIKYSNSKEERRNKKELKEISAATPDSQIREVPRPSAPAGTSAVISSSSSANAVATLVPLRGGTTSAGTEVVKTREGSGPRIHYAKITTRRPTKNTGRRKINFDFNVVGSTAMNKLTFATTDKFWEWIRDIKRDYEDGSLTEQQWQWYQTVAEDYKRVKAQIVTATIGKGCQRGNSKAVVQTACIYTGTEAQVYIGDWQHTFELEPILNGRASQHHDSVAEYRSNRTGYQDLTWE